MKWRLLTIVLFLGILTSPKIQAQQKPPQLPQQKPKQEKSISAIYESKGKNPDGTDYKGVVVIQKYGDTYRVAWHYGSGTVPVLGMGILKGDIFSVSYFITLQADIVSVGLVSYRVEGDRLVGEWTVLGADGFVFPEVLIKVKGQLVPDVPKPDPVPSKPRKKKPQINQVAL